MISGLWEVFDGAGDAHRDRSFDGWDSYLETRVRALANERIDRIDVAGRGRSKKPTRRHVRCPLNTGRVGTQMWSLANLKCTFRSLSHLCERISGFVIG